MENWTKPSFLANDVTAEETAVRERYHAAIEQATETYMNESKYQDIVGIEMFPS